MGVPTPVFPKENFETFQIDLQKFLVLPAKFTKEQWNIMYIDMKHMKSELGWDFKTWVASRFHDWTIGEMENELFDDEVPVYKSAHLSSDKLHRFYLMRIWDRKKPLINYIMLNPSTADAEKDDPTTRKLIHYTKQEGYGGYIVTNLCSFRTSSPKVLFENYTPGYIYNADTDYWTKFIASNCDKHVLAWGNNGASYKSRIKFVHKTPSLIADKADKIIEPWCFGVSNHDQPMHPLYLKLTTKLIPFELAVFEKIISKK